MPHDVFISYSSHDKAVADATCAAIEAQKIRCWIAPRDVLAGTEYGEAIISAIEDCRAMVLVFSDHANKSPHIRREVERAVSKGKIIVPFRIENVLPSRAMEYCLSNTHWLDAMTPPLEKRIDELVVTVGRLLAKGGGSEPTQSHVKSQMVTFTQAQGHRRILADDVAEYRKRATSGEAEAQFQLGTCYAVGAHVPKDDSKAIEWYLKAAEQGHSDAQFKLGLCSYSLKISPTAPRFGVETLTKLGLRDSGRIADSATDANYVKAAYWYRKAAKQGHAEAQFWLGLCYDSPIGVAKNMREAAAWYRKAAEQGFTSAQEKLGYCYQYGKGVEQDFAEAVHWYEPAARQGNQDAQYALGCCYRNGDGVPEDWDKAIEWFRLAAAQGSPDAKQALEELGTA